MNTFDPTFRSADASATPWAWLPALAVTTLEPGDSSLMRRYAPRSLNDPVRWRFSHFRTRGRPAIFDRLTGRSTGVTRVTPSRTRAAARTSSSVVSATSVLLLLTEVEEAVALVAERQPRLPQVHVPVTPDRGVVLLHAVVGDEHERGVVEHSRPLDRGEDLAQTGVTVAYRRGRDLGVGPALVERRVGEREVAPHELRRRVVHVAVMAAPDPDRLLDPHVVDDRRPRVVLRRPHEPLGRVGDALGTLGDGRHLVATEEVERRVVGPDVGRLVDGSAER